ncbi:hypothetical protein RI367_007309 [Sorochytrium milnesiophthora]
MSCSLPFSGGPATFAQAAFGQGVFVSTLCNFPADSSNMMPLLWLVLLQLLVLTNYRPHFYFKFAMVIAALCCLLLACYVLASLVHLGMVLPSLYDSATPTTITSVIQALPFAISFYWGIETIPLTAEECHNISTTAPRATLAGLSVLTIFSALVMWLNAGLMPSLDALVNSNQVIVDSFFFQLGVPLTSAVAVYASACIMIIPSIGWAHVNLYAAARHTYSLARAGYLPIALSYTTHGSPINATLACAGLAYVFAVVLSCILANSGVNVNNAQLQVTTWLLCVSYCSELVVFVRLRYKMPQLPRPWRSPVGVPGAVVGVLITFLGIFGPFATDAVTTGWIFGTYLTFMLLFVVYYHWYAKKRLRDSPEKEFINAQMKRLYKIRIKEGSTK